MKLLLLATLLITSALCKPIEFSDEQKRYIETKKVLKMCVDPNWMPIEMIENNGYIGISADVIREVSQSLKMPIVLVQTKEWRESLLKAKTKECDIVASAQETPMRKKYLNFTAPYIHSSLVIATRVGIDFTDNIEEIKHEKLAIVRDHSTQELLVKKYPDINLVLVSSIQEGLILVEEEKIFGFLDSFIVLNHEIKKRSLKNVTITGQLKEEFSLSIGSRNDEPILGEILQLALNSIPKNKIDETVYKWNNFKHKTESDNKLIGIVVFFGFALLSIFVYWNLQLKDEMKKREKTQEALKQSEEKFRTLFNIAPVFINSFDENGNILMWNNECERVFGWSLEELKNTKDIVNLFYPDAKEQNFIKNRLIKEKNNIFEEWHPTTKNGDKIVTMWANIALSSKEYIHIGYDVTKERKVASLMIEKTEQLEMATQQLEELNRDLESKVYIEVEKNAKNQLLLLERNKLAQMGEMIENIAHQWRQPLSEINSLVLLLDQHLMQKKCHDDIIEEKLSSVEGLTYHMSKTIDNFKNFFNTSKKQQAFVLHKVVAETLIIIKGSTEYNYIDITLDVDKKFECDGYPHELQEVLLIILNNARDALVQNKIKEPKIEIKVVQESNEYILSVCDNAGGVPEEFADKIFEPYFSTKHKKQGTGIGLYMAKIIAQERLQGKLELENMSNGACFLISFLKEIVNSPTNNNQAQLSIKDKEHI